MSRVIIPDASWSHTLPDSAEAFSLYAFRTLPHDLPTASTAVVTLPPLDALGIISKSFDACCAKE